MKARWLLPSVLLFSHGLAGCSQKKEDSCETNIPAPSCAALDYAALDPAAVSFQTDLFPRVRAGCASQLCHGIRHDQNPDLPSGGLYLGNPVAKDPSKDPDLDPTLLAADAALVLDDLGKTAETSMSMQRVVPSLPQQSFTMLKLTGCLSGISDCKAKPTKYEPTYAQGCGDSMPPPCAGEATGWTPDDTKLFARWIAQGALSN
jgi:hypothetical protein